MLQRFAVLSSNHVTYVIIIYVIPYQMHLQNPYMTFICPPLSRHSVHSSNRPIRRSCRPNIVDRPFRKPYWLLLNRLLSMKCFNISSLINPSITLHGMLVKLT